MKNKLVNFFIILLLLVMVLLKFLSSSLFNIYNNLLCYFCILLVVVASIYFSFKLNFIQFNIIKIARTIKKCNSNDIKALFMSMGAKIGVGSIAGISLAIYVSGPGVLFWIWVISLLSSILTYCESYLGMKYKQNCNGKNNGGVFYYLSKGLNNHSLAFIYTLLLIFVYAIGFVGIQSNTIVKSVNYITYTNSYIIVSIMCLLVAIIIFNKIDSIVNFMSKLVPFMCLLYLVLGLFIIINNWVNISNIFNIIIEDALNLDRSICGIIVVGLKRGIFATESGLGTSSISSSISDSSPDNQGVFQVLGVHFISLVVITITGLIIVGSEYNYIGNINGIEIVMSIFYNYYSSIGSLSLCVIVILFAISTIISGYYYGIKGLEFIMGSLNKLDYLLFKLLIVLLVFLGGIVESTIIWSIIDDLILFLLIINIYSLIKLRKKVQ